MRTNKNTTSSKGYEKIVEEEENPTAHALSPLDSRANATIHMVSLLSQLRHPAFSKLGKSTLKGLLGSVVPHSQKAQPSSLEEGARSANPQPIYKGSKEQKKSKQKSKKAARNGNGFLPPIYKPSRKEGLEFVSMAARGDVTTILSSSAGSVVNTVYTVEPSGGSYTFDEFSTLFDAFNEWRYCSAIFHWERIGEGPKSSTNATILQSGLIVAVFDYDDSNALTTYATALQYDKKVVMTYHSGHKMSVRFDFAPDQEWIDCNSTRACGYLKHYGNTTTGIGASQGYYFHWCELHLQFRGLR